MTPTSRFAKLLERTDIPCPECGYNLRRNLSGRCPECGSKLTLQVIAVGGRGRRSITGALAYVRAGLILIPLTLVSFQFVNHLATVPTLAAGFINPIRIVLLVTFGVATALGAATFGSLFVARRIHFVLSILFFGLVTFILALYVVTALLSGMTFRSLGIAVATYAMMSGILFVAIAGLIIEIICDRRLRTGSQIEFSASEPESPLASQPKQEESAGKP